MTPQLRKDIIEWDVLNWSQALEVWQPIIDQLPKDAKILAIGERNGGLTLWLALQGFNVLCTDRNVPTETARSLHAKYGVSDKISYEALDVCGLYIPRNQFDLVIMKSVLGGLKSDYKNAATRTQAARQQAIQNIFTFLKPGGYLLSADNMQGSVLMHLFRQLNGKNKGWHYFSRSQLQQIMQPFSNKTIHSVGLFPTLFPSGILNTIAFFINKYLLQWLPANTKYIGITIARK